MSEVQRSFVEKLLENSVFNKHLTAVREINNMLQRAKDVRASCGEANAGKPMKVSVPSYLACSASAERRVPDQAHKNLSSVQGYQCRTCGCPCAGFKYLALCETERVAVLLFPYMHAE